MIEASIDGPKHKTQEPKLSSPQSVKKHYIGQVIFQTYLLANRFAMYDDTVSNYIAEVVKVDS